MWIAWIFAIVIVLLLLGGVVVGGVYAAVLLPIAAIILIGALIYTLWARDREPKRMERERQVDPLPHTPGQNATATPSTPDDIVDARRQAQ
jgi:hypothetical protein